MKFKLKFIYLIIFVVVIISKPCISNGFLIDNIKHKENYFEDLNIVIERKSKLNNDIKNKTNVLQLLKDDSFTIRRAELNEIIHCDDLYKYILRKNRTFNKNTHLSIFFFSDWKKENEILDLISYGAIKISNLLEICEYRDEKAKDNQDILELKTNDKSITIYFLKKLNAIYKVDIKMDTCYHRIYEFSDFYNFKSLKLPRKYCFILIDNEKKYVYDKGIFKYFVQKEKFFRLNDYPKIHVQDNRLFPPENYNIKYFSGWLGIVFNPIISNEIKKIYKNTPAEKAGLKEKDIIIRVDKKKVNNFEECFDILKYKEVGEIFLLTILRDSKEMTVKIKKDRSYTQKIYKDGVRDSILSLKEIYNIAKIQNKEVQTIPYFYTEYNGRKKIVKFKESVIRKSKKVPYK